MSGTKKNGADLNGKTTIIEPRFRLIPFDKLQPSPAPAYLIKGLIPRIGLTVVWGPPKCGKSFWMTDALLHAALGWPYRGRKVIQGPVVYCAFEGQDGYGKRAEAFRQRHLAESADPVPFYLVATSMSLVKDHLELIKAIEMQLGDVKPVAVALDTLNRSLTGSESDDKDMSAYIAAGEKIRETFDCAVPIVHHCGIDGSRPRGHSSLTGAVVAQIAVKRDAASNVATIVEFMKDGAEGETTLSKLEPVEVGLDEDGDAISSCVVLPVDGDVAPAGRKLSARDKLALDALTNCALDRGKPPPFGFGLPSGLLAIEIDQWREELFARGILDRKASNPRTDFKRVKESLQVKHLIGVRDDMVWSAANG
jgi:AAA domain